MKIRTGDVVKVLCGDDRGKEASVIRTLPNRDRIVLEGINLVHKHMRKTKDNPKGGRVQKEAPIHVSNVRLVTPREEVSGKKKDKKAKK